MVRSGSPSTARTMIGTRSRRPHTTSLRRTLSRTPTRPPRSCSRTLRVLRPKPQTPRRMRTRNLHQSLPRLCRSRRRPPRAAPTSAVVVMSRLSRRWPRNPYPRSPPQRRDEARRPNPLRSRRSCRRSATVPRSARARFNCSN